MAGSMRELNTRSIREAKGGGIGEWFFTCHNGAKYSKCTVEVGRPFYLMVVRYSAESFCAGSKARITKFCA
jgi:hypothetical protein